MMYHFTDIGSLAGSIAGGGVGGGVLPLIIGVVRTMLANDFSSMSFKGNFSDR